MKKIKVLMLIAQRIYTLYRNNKFISLIYTMCFIVSVLVFTYVYNNFMPTVTRTAADDSFDHYYAFYFTEEITDISALREYLELYDTNYVTYCHMVSSQTGGTDDENSDENSGNDVVFEVEQEDYSTDTIEINEGMSEYNSAIPYIISYKNDEVKTTLVEGRLEFSEQEKSGEINAAILPANSTLGVLPESFEHNNVTYNAVGWHVGEAMIIPEQLFVEQGLGVYKIEIYLNNVLSSLEHEKLIEDICSMYSVDKITSPENMNDLYEGNSRQILLIITIGFSIMVFVFGYLLKYLIIAGKNENMIYRLVGAGNGEIIAIIAMENLIIHLILSVFSVCIHAVLFERVFDKINFYQNVRLGVGDYIIITGITSVFSFIAVLPHIIKTVSSTLISNKNRT